MMKTALNNTNICSRYSLITHTLQRSFVYFLTLYCLRKIISYTAPTLTYDVRRAEVENVNDKKLWKHIFEL